jgi:endonuclease/exonuclease/phosphatase family metal-dependent hydrolase
VRIIVACGKQFVTRFEVENLVVMVGDNAIVARSRKAAEHHLNRSANDMALGALINSKSLNESELLMRILSYNIYEGAQSEGKDRIESVIDLIREIDPDLVGLCECKRFWEDGSARLQRFKDALDMRAVMNHAASGNHVALLYRQSVPVVAEDASSVTMYHGFSSVVVSLPRVGRTAIIMTHLHPRSVIMRLAEAQCVLAKATFEPNAVVMGDFNALAETDEKAIASQLSLNGQIRLLDGKGLGSTSAVSTFTRYGFVDLGAAEGAPTCPTRLVENNTIEKVALRLDYILVTSKLAKMARMSMITTSKAHMASDHFPLVCELMTEPRT